MVNTCDHGIPVYSKDFTEVETRMWFQLLVSLIEQLNAIMPLKHNLIRKYLALQYLFTLILVSAWVALSREL